MIVRRTPGGQQRLAADDATPLLVGDTVISPFSTPEAHHHAARRDDVRGHIAAGAAQELAASRLLRRRAGRRHHTCTVAGGGDGCASRLSHPLHRRLARRPRAAARPAAENGWYPGGGRAACTVFSSAAGFDFVGVDASDGRRQLFNNLAAARASLLSDFSEYDFIMMDLAPMLEGREDSINPLAAATICEAAFLICRAGIETSREVETALSRLRASGCRLEGVILKRGLV